MILSNSDYGNVMNATASRLLEYKSWLFLYYIY